MRKLLIVAALCAALVPLSLRAQTPGINLIAGQAQPHQYNTGLVPWFTPQYLFSQATSVNGNSGTTDSVLISKNGLNGGLHTLAIWAGGFTTSSSASTKSVKLQVCNGSTCATKDSVKITASAASEWVLQCTLQIRNAGTGGVQPIDCSGLSQSATPTVNLISADTMTIDPQDSVVKIKVVTSDSVAGDVVQNTFLGLLEP